MVNKYFKNEILEILFLVVYAVIVLGIASLIFGFGLGGFEQEAVLQKNNFYLPYGTIFLIGLIVVQIISLFVFSGKDKTKDGALIHDPEQGMFTKSLINKNPFLLYFFSIIIFALIGWYASQYQTFFSDIPKFEQQFTVGADLFFSVYPASPSETFGALFLVSLVGLIIGLFVKSGKLSRNFFLVLFIPLGTLVSMFYGIINHLARYGSSDVAIQNVMVFWGLGGFITTITGSVIPFLVMHDVNNFYVRFSKLFGSDIVTFVTFTAIGILIFSFLIVYFKVKNKNVVNK